MYHVARQLTDVANDTATQRRPVFVSRRNFGWYAKHTVGVRTRLAHQDVAFFRLQLFAARRMFPEYLYVPAYNASAAGTAASSRTLIRQIDALTQNGIEDRFLCTAIEGAPAAFAFYRYLHRHNNGLLEEVVVLFFCVLKFVD